MKITPALFAAALSFCLLSCGSADERSAGSPPSTDSLQAPPPATATPHVTGDVQISGLLRSGGLQPDEAKALGVKANAYQLIAGEAYFLDGPDSLAKYEGQCLTLSGQVASGWEEGPEQKNGQYTYKRKLLMVEAAVLEAMDHCYYADTLTTRPTGRNVIYLGMVERMQRPAPDIAYDYQLRLQKPYRNPNDPVQPGRLVRMLPLTTTNFELLSTLEKAVREKQQLRVRGIQHQGYAESEAIWVEAAGMPDTGVPATGMPPDQGLSF